MFGFLLLFGTLMQASCHHWEVSGPMMPGWYPGGKGWIPGPHFNGMGPGVAGTHWQPMDIRSLASLVLPPSCGQRFVSTVPLPNRGVEAIPNSWPWQVSIQKNGVHICGGSLINNQWVLTSSYCNFTNFGGNFIDTVILGEHDFIIRSGREVVRSAVIYKYQQYNPTLQYVTDIALLRLSFPVEFNQDIYPICLPEPSSVFTRADDCWVTGWGQVRGPTANKLNELQLPVMSNAECSFKWGPNHIFKHHICGGPSVPRHCFIEIGGPYSCRRRNHLRWELAAIPTLRTWNCLAAARPNVFTRVSEYIYWILHTIYKNT